MSSAAAQDFSQLYREAEAARVAGQLDAVAVQRRFARALAAFDAQALVGAARAQALPAVATCALQAGAPERAVALIAESVARGGVDAVHAEVQVTALVRAGQARAAVAAVSTWSTQHPAAVERALASVVGSSGGALCEAAEVALREGKTAEGLLTFASIAKVCNRNPVSLANLALAYRHVGREADSEACYREALAAAPNDPDLWNDLGLLMKGLRRDDAAMAAFAKSLSLETQTPPSGPATSNLLTMARAGRAPAASAVPSDRVAALAGVLSRVPDAAMARYLLLRELTEPSPPTAFPAAQTDTGGHKR